MSEYVESIAGQAQWAVRNLNYNLDFIPDDKLAWKPAPKANSALEVVDHMLGAFGFFTAAITKEEVVENPKLTSRDEAKEKLQAAADHFCEVIRGLSAERMAENVELPFGTFPMSFFISMPALDAVHHHGQIAYIQTLLGDEESHFDFSLLPKA